MPKLASRFRSSVSKAIAIAEAGEIARALSPPRSRVFRELSVNRLEALHEMAYLRMFVEWEIFIEASFIRMMCGYQSSLFTPIFASGKSRQPDLGTAFNSLSGGRGFLLWHDPRHIRDRGQAWFSGGPHEAVAVSSYSRLEWFGWVRHRVAHGSDDARRKLDAATLGLCGRRYRGASAGRFLRSWNTSATPQERWLYTIGDELSRLAAQIAP
jgi:hypothetical protein